MARAPALCAAAAGVVWLVAHVGISPLVPTHVGWVMQGDLAASQMGWVFFRQAPWAFPLGWNSGYPWPVGSSLAFSDSIPLVAVLLKPLTAYLPVSFQYLGPWLALSFALQGYLGARLTALFTDGRAAQALGGALLALSPALLHRLVGPNTSHAALCGHFLLLSFLWLALAPVAGARGARRRLAAALAITTIASGVHPYHLVMALAMGGALLLRLATIDRRLRRSELVAWALGAVGAAAGGLAIFGYLGGASTPAEGFGYFSADPLTLLNPMGWSRALPSLPVGPGQYEGFGFIGAGVLALGSFALVLLALRRRLPADGAWRRVRIALVPCAALAILALSDTIQSGGKVLLRIPAYQAAPALVWTLRSTGRFVWPLHYLATITAIGAVAVGLRSRPRAAAAALGVALAIQAVDVRPPVPAEFDRAGFQPIGSDAWELARGEYRHLALIPPLLLDGSGRVAPEACGGPPPWDPDLWVVVGDLAARLGLTTNSAYVARLDVQGISRSCDEERRALAAGRLEQGTIYLVHPAPLGAFRAAGAACGRLDRAPVCVDGRRQDGFRQALRAAPLW